MEFKDVRNEAENHVRRFRVIYSARCGLWCFATTRRDATRRPFGIILAIGNSIFREHIASVLCVTCAFNDTLLISGGEDSRIIVTSLANGQVAIKIDHHRGPVTQLLYTSIGNVFVSGECTSSYGGNASNAYGSRFDRVDLLADVRD